MPGDTLVVHLDRRAHQSRQRLSDQPDRQHRAGTGLSAGIAKYESGFTRWKIDAAAGIATVIDPSGKLSAYSVKLSPMLGCIGVAPPREETLGSGHLGPFGGNMDSPEVKEGATLYIPVFQPGALLLYGRRPCPAGRWRTAGPGAGNLAWTCSSAWT